MIKNIYLDQLISHCHEAKNTNPIEKYIITNTNELDSLKDISNSIYIIKLVDGDLNQVFNTFKEFKDKKERACSKLNQPSEVLYIGSSVGKITYRLKHHLIEGPIKTYSLHMKNWFTGKYSVEIQEYNVSPEVLQLIEDSISFELKPAFGKRGGNNRSQ